jgi:hypothetical protein
MITNTATANRAEDFIKYLIKHPHEREKLQDATAVEIVQAGKVAGYDFTESDLDDLIQRLVVTGKPPVAGQLWGRLGNC